MWKGNIHRKGYGTIRNEGKMVKMHRYFYEVTNHITIPDGLVIDHLCRVRPCVNPSHLEAVTSKENTRRGILFTCTHGDGFRKEGVGKCLKCVEIINKNYYQKHRERILTNKSSIRMLNRNTRQVGLGGF